MRCECEEVIVWSESEWCCSPVLYVHARCYPTLLPLEASLGLDQAFEAPQDRRAVECPRDKGHRWQAGNLLASWSCLAQVNWSCIAELVFARALALADAMKDTAQRLHVRACVQSNSTYECPEREAQRCGLGGRLCSMVQMLSK